MKPKDHIHNHNKNYPENIKVFNETYKFIDSMAKKITEIEAIAFDITDPKTKSELERINAIHVSDEIINLVNYAIEHYRKPRL